jgi:hypothetical protein
MHYDIADNRKSLTFSVTQAERKAIRGLGHKADTDQALYDFFSDIDLEWIDPAETGDLTSAPMLGLRDDARQVSERWAFMDYQVRSVLGDLRDYGRAVFVSD